MIVIQRRNTIRRDVNQLKREGLIKKNYGGAILSEEIENVSKPQGLVSFSSFQDVDLLITSDLADADILNQITNLGVKIIVCPVKNEDN